MKKKRLGKRNRRHASSQEDRIKKKCLSCGVHFALSGSGRRQKYCSKCAKRRDGRGRGLPGSKPLKTKAAKTVSEIDLGSFVLAQIKGQARQPVSFTTPDDDRVRIWTSDHTGRKGDRSTGGSISTS